MLKVISFAVAFTSILVPNSSALADARSTAEFVLKICLPAMDDLSNVEGLAQENNWTKSPPVNLGRLRTRNSRWEVTQGGDRVSEHPTCTRFSCLFCELPQQQYEP
jgi:hypothetical protein